MSRKKKKKAKQRVLDTNTQPEEVVNSSQEDSHEVVDSTQEGTSGELLLEGRPTKYDPKMCEVLKKVFREGGYIAEACEEMGISSLKTFHNWRHKYPEFQEAYEEALIASQAWHERVGKAAMLGQLKGFNFPVWARIMGAKFKKEYGDPAKDYSKKTEINIGSINSIENMNSKDLDEKIKALGRKLDLLPKTDNE